MSTYPSSAERISRFTRSRCLLILLVLFLCPAPAFAHKLYVYPESIEGATIHGYAYFPGDLPARRIEVIVRDARGRELGRTTTDDKGKFTFTAREHIDHLLLAQTPDGHTGMYTIHASELPESLPSGDATAENGPPAKAPTADGGGPPVAPAGKENEPTAIKDQLTELRTELSLLRRQISESDERLRFRDILGGIGFILGLAGVAMYMKTRRNRI